MSGFSSPNYTQTPNDLFDELLPEMGLAELKVVMVIIRNTFGYHRDEVKLSVRALARATGMTAKSTLAGAEQAEAHGLIERHQDGKKITLWRAIVSVIPSNTKCNTKYHKGVLPATTHVRVKESKETKNNGADAPKSPPADFPMDWQLGHGQEITPQTEQEQFERQARDIANLIDQQCAGAGDLAYAFMTTRGILLPLDEFGKNNQDVKKHRKAAREMLKQKVKAEHVREAVKKLLESKMTVTDLFSVQRTAIDIANPAPQPPSQTSILRTLS
jgi:hypothetical protein